MAVGLLVGGVLDRLATLELNDFIYRWDIDLDEVENLEQTLVTIQALTDDAEVKQFTNAPVKRWLNRQKQFVYDAEDILDRYVTEILRVKLESSSQSQIHVPNPSQDYDISKEVDRIKEYGSKIKNINQRLGEVLQKGRDLGLSLSSSTRGDQSSSRRPKVFSERPPTSSLVERDRVFGREEDKAKIIKFLLRDEPTTTTSGNKTKNSNFFSVLPIVGMGGSGKTTLAQLVFGDEKMRHFQVKAWVCVGEDFDIVRITKEILQSVTGRKPEFDQLDWLQNQLKATLSNKRFLVVLDDVWNRNYNEWDQLRSPFVAGGQGSTVLVTTRDYLVSSIMRSNVSAHTLNCLSDEDCIKLLRSNTLVDGNSWDNVHRKLEIFGGKIAQKCKGLPLAVKTIGGLLRDKTEDGEWEAILKNEIWDLEESDILPSLMLSYHHLPPHLKRCFAYCALFPKDYLFDKAKLVRLWMAEGIVQLPKGSKKRLEDIGVVYFHHLFMRSFFELSNRASEFSLDREGLLLRSVAIKSFSSESSSNINSAQFVIHDLIHDLAQFVSGEIYWRREGDDKPSKFPTVATRHLSYQKPTTTMFSDIKEMKGMRTLLQYKIEYDYVTEQVFSITHHQFLRVLCLSLSEEHELPDSIGDLKSLRLIDLSGSDIVRLPDSIGSLYNLQTLILSRCFHLRELPKDMGDLLNLRHLILPGLLKIEKMPLGVGRLTSLQTLTGFRVYLEDTGSGSGSRDSSRIGELKDLSQLRGSLTIRNLENVRTADSMEAILKNKPHLLELGLYWSYYGSKDSFPDTRDEEVEEKVLDQLLQPHTNLEMLGIYNYGGTIFPSWVGHPSFSKLVAVRLVGCRKCIFLPSLGLLPSLKLLQIEDCIAVKSAGRELYGDAYSSSVNYKQFLSLETLEFHSMTEWEEWSEVVKEEQGAGEEFPRLHELRIIHCPKLRRFSHRFSRLVTLTIKFCDELSKLPRILPSLQLLKIKRCGKLAFLPSLLPSIQKLELQECNQMTALFDDSQHPSSSSSPHEREGMLLPYLRELTISRCCSLLSLPKGLHMLTSLHTLEIKDCPALESFPDMGLPTSLQYLSIQRYEKLSSLSKGLHKLTSLLKLRIEDCPVLESFPDMGLPTSLQDLSIQRCEKLSSLPKGLHKLTSLLELRIEDCPALESFPDMGLPTSLQGLSIQRCEKLSSLPKGLHNLTSLLELQIKDCPVLESFPDMGLPTSLQDLSIQRCEKLSSLPKGLHKLTSLPELRIKDCPVLESFPDMGLPTSLRYLSIQRCEKLSSLPKGLHKLTSLIKLRIEDCPALESFPDMGLPTSLQYLSIQRCEKLSSLPKGLHKLTFLHLRIGDCLALESFPDMGLPTSLQYLSIQRCEKLSSLPKGLHMLTSLHTLEIEDCPALESFPDMGLPTSLQDLSIQRCEKLSSLPRGLHNLTNLMTLKIVKCLFLMECKNLEPLIHTSGLYNNNTSLSSLTVGGFPALMSIPKGLLPTNLRYFGIEDCPVLESLHGLSDRTSLQRLRIANCPILESLHDGLSDLTSLQRLWILNCPLLKQRYQREGGEDWSRIAHIPKVFIDNEWQ